MNKRIFKLQDIPYKDGKVLCARIGRKSGRVLVTGGEDKKVTMWAIGKPDCIMSLVGHSTPVECVTFDAAEEVVAAGSSGGTIKLWDLDQQKVIRTLNGHKSNCISIDFHPFGEYFASGSLDTYLKIWDVRKKGCIQTYKGHSKGVNTLHFSPDGRWIISGGDDGVVKLWDLTAGKLLCDLNGHKGPITSLEFHPHEFLLATGSSDKTVKFWDLETYELVSSSEPESSVVRALSFNTEGDGLLAAYTDTVRVWGWEPIRCYEALDVAWKEVADMHITNEQLVCCSIAPTQSALSVWMLNPQKMLPVSKEKFTVDTTKPSSVRNSLESSKTSEVLKQLTSPKPKSKEESPPVSNIEASKAKEPNTKGKDDKGSTQSSSPTSGATVSEKQIDMSDFTVRYMLFVLTLLKKLGLKGSEIIDELMKQHVTMCDIMGSRLANIKVMRNMWTKSDAKETLDILSKLNDASVVVDVLNSLLTSSVTATFTLDVCITLLPLLQDLLSSQYEEYVVTSLKTVQLLATSFGNLIKSTLEAPPSGGVDLSREERTEKCKMCLAAFRSIKTKLLDDNSAKPTQAQLRKDVIVSLKGFVS